MDFSYLTVFKIIVVPMLIWIMTHAGRRWGAIAAGSLSAFPVVVAPALLFISIDQGKSFATKAAVTSLSGVLALIVFSLSYGWAATILPWSLSIILSLLTYSATVIYLNHAQLSLSQSSIIILCVLLFIRRVFPKWQIIKNQAPVIAHDLPVRMIIGGTLVFTLTLAASKIGPSWSGIFAMFPVTGSVLLVFSHIYQGKAFASNLVHGMFLGWCSVSLFCGLVSLLMPTQSIFFTFLIALLVAITSQAVGYLIIYRRLRVSVGLDIS